MNKEQTIQQMRSLKLRGMAVAYQSIVELPTHEQPNGHALIAQLIESELYQRQSSRMQILLRVSKLRYAATLEQVQCSPTRNLTQEQLLRLIDLSFIKKGENVIITGPTGVGKSYLACALGHQACMHGYKVYYYNMVRLVEKINIAKLEGTYHKLLNYFQQCSLVIIDDFGLAPIDHSAKIALLQILEDKIEKGSIVITSQLPVKDWFEYIADPTLADAIMDRLLAKHHRIELTGESFRKINKIQYN